jgi:hypothetical protein
MGGFRPFDPNSSGGGGGSVPIDNLTGGWANYSDLATQTTPITVLMNAAPVKVPNDALGSLTDETYLPIAVSRLYNTVTQQFDFTDMSVGDMVTIGFDLEGDTTWNTQFVDITFVSAIGTASELSTSLARGTEKSSNAPNPRVTRTVKFAALDANFINAPAELRISSDNNVDLTVHSFFISLELIGR